MDHPTFSPSSKWSNFSLLADLFAWKRDEWNSGANCILLNLLDIGDYDGTILYDPAMTPKNTAVFASTGGDDVHFSLLEQDGQFGDSSPVVMTVPMASSSPAEANFIVGSSLHEFLCVGCTHGYFRLEAMAYSRLDEFLAYLTTEPEDPNEYSQYRQRFNLTPWDRIADRLAELERDFKPQLRYRRRGFWSRNGR